MRATISIRVLESPEQASAGAVYESDSVSPGLIEIAAGDGSGVPYDAILQLGDDSSDAAHLFVVGIELEPGHEADFEDWYNTEHLPALAQVPGVNGARRYRRAGSSGESGHDYPEYLALYAIASPDIAGNEDWRAAVETPWTVRLRPHFRAVWRGGYRLSRASDRP